VGRQIAPLALGPVGRRPGMDETGIEREAGCGAEAAFLQLVRSRIEDSGVRGLDQVEGGLAPPGVVEIQDDAPLAAVEAEIARLVRIPVTAAALDLDDLRAKVREERGCHRPGYALREIQ